MKSFVVKSMMVMFAGWFAFAGTGFADAAPGDVIVTLGEDLNSDQRAQLLDEMDVNEDDVLMVEVTNEEEHHYLGEYISASRIGSNALSSTKITLLEEGEGVNVETNRIDWVTEAMYANALVTAGVEDADIYVTAPFNVSGTAALTGLIKAYELSTDEVIPEEQKQVANEEMVKTAELGENVGVDKAAELMTRIKEEIAEGNVETEEDLRDLIDRVAHELGIELTEEEMNGLVSLFQRMQNLDIDWNQVQDQIGKIRDNLSEFLASEEGQGLIDSILNFFNSLIDAIRSWATNMVMAFRQ
ncbi:DUF1002 domain-containing protein [Alteribacter natronophilus]|uniref:DUF1002 domain-containing protein n=1 Tax=Alteribacter natronophilus TaxID=2583810 RepID=UPI00110E1EFC|nr:DUF1002 domain-containing protein [Alteribacter natronophilus]TMW73818.1 DUF1002 domain-containing protein [Alteribacter natronophilus]